MNNDVPAILERLENVEVYGREHIPDIVKLMAIYEREFSQAMRHRTIRETAFKIAHAVAYGKSEGTIPERKENTFLAVQAEYNSWQEAKTIATIFREKLEDCRTTLWTIREVVKSENQNFQATNQFQT